jgi:outer membrane protein OmpU
MKKFLIATTALVATAGVAAADVRVSGDGRFGISHAAGVNTLNGRVRVNFGLSAQGDNGLEFGGFYRVRNNNFGGVDESVAGLFIGAEGFRLNVGNFDGAAATRVAIYGGGLGYTGRIGRPSTHGAAGFLEQSEGLLVVRADYDNAGFGASLSSDGVGGNIELGLAYSMDGLSVGFGWADATSIWSISASYKMDDITVGALYTDGNYRLWASYAMGDITVGATYTNDGADNFGIGASYALGGGARLHGAIGQHAGATQAELGVTFAF